MGSKAGPGEGGTAQGPWVILGVGGGPQKAGARGSPGVVREVGRVPALADGCGEGAAIFSGEVVQQGAALLEGEVARIGEVFWLPVEDIMEEVEVVAEEDEEQEQQEEQMLEEPGPSPKSAPSPLEVLEAVQLQMEPLNRQCTRACARLKLRTLWRRKTYLEHRSTIIQSIPGFWVKVFVNHHQMSATMNDLDKDMLRYMTNLKVEELRYPSDCCKIVLFFRNNRYFQNEVVVKEYLINVTGYVASHSTPIQWHQRFESEAYSRRHHSSSRDFFRWFCDHSFAGSSRIAEIISEDLWPNPLLYYPREEGTTGTEPSCPQKARALVCNPKLHIAEKSTAFGGSSPWSSTLEWLLLGLTPLKLPETQCRWAERLGLKLPPPLFPHCQKAQPWKFDMNKERGKAEMKAYAVLKLNRLEEGDPQKVKGTEASWWSGRCQKEPKSRRDSSGKLHT
ncbi:testis-specific Y-encoded protein 3-like [Eschrichtius robustus]|uniref:testis-specific Y-encoded protein 3-like n=1 Tax=Eschrichtius robustus TaxID=9764 RepID=UPI0035BEF80C